MTSRARAVLAAVAIGLLASATPAAPASRAVPLTPTRIAKYGITLGLPKGWKSQPPTAEMRKVHVVFLALTRSPHDGISANLNVIVTPLAPGQTLSQWLFGNNVRFRKAGVTTTVVIDGRRSLHYVSTTFFHTSDGHALLTDEYAFQRDGTAILFTYTALASDRKQFLPVFAASAQSIRL